VAVPHPSENMALLSPAIVVTKCGGVREMDLTALLNRSATTKFPWPSKAKPWGVLNKADTPAPFAKPDTAGLPARVATTAPGRETLLTAWADVT
jgi:hypothetical protein